MDTLPKFASIFSKLALREAFLNLNRPRRLRLRGKHCSGRHRRCPCGHQRRTRPLATGRHRYTLRKIFFRYRIHTGMKQNAVNDTE